MNKNNKVYYIMYNTYILGWSCLVFIKRKNVIIVLKN